MEINEEVLDYFMDIIQKNYVKQIETELKLKQTLKDYQTLKGNELILIKEKEELEYKLENIEKENDHLNEIIKNIKEADEDD